MNRNLRRSLIPLILVLACGCSHREQPEPKSIDAGVPLYPGSKSVLSSDSFSQRLLPQDRAKVVKAVIYETEDPSTKVITFYKNNLKGKYQVLESKHGGLPSAVFRVEIEGQYKLLMITEDEDSGRTQIVIGNIKPPQGK